MARIEITEAIRKQLNTLRDTTGIGPQRLLRGRRDKPKSLNAAMIYHWLKGIVTSANTHHISYVLKLWQSVDPIIDVTSDMTLEAKALFDETGFSHSAFLRYASDLPSSLNKDMFLKLLAGQRKTIPLSAWEAIVRNLENAAKMQRSSLSSKATPTARSAKGSPSKEPQKRPYIGRASNLPISKPKDKQPYISGFSHKLRLITDEELAQLKSFITATKTSPAKMLSQSARKTPDKLNEATIRQWLNGKIKRTSSSRMKWVLEEYRRIDKFQNR